jgi:ABC-type dipeptide/oligopeptide/nickel transport system ATPase component
MNKYNQEKILDIKNLSVTYHSGGTIVPAVKNISFSLQKNKMLGIIGETGSGKSSLIRAVNGLIKYPGVTSFEELDILSKNGIDNTFDFSKMRGKELGFIPQNPFGSLNPVYKISKQFKFVNNKHKLFNKNQLGNEIIRALTEVGIADPERVSNSYSFELSGGMAQRVVIALACFARPKLLFADEPTTGLDVTVERQLLDNFFTLVNNNDMTLIIVTHDLGIVAQYCNEAIVMYEGEIVEKGSIEKIFLNPEHVYTQKLIKASSEEIS